MKATVAEILIAIANAKGPIVVEPNEDIDWVRIESTSGSRTYSLRGVITPDQAAGMLYDWLWQPYVCKPVVKNTYYVEEGEKINRNKVYTFKVQGHLPVNNWRAWEN